MPMPDGTSKIVYTVMQYGENGGPDVGAEATFAITANNFESVDIAAAAAMNTFIETLEAMSPSAVTASRTYECNQPGELWPTPKKEGSS